MYLALLARHLDRRRFAISAVLPPDPGTARLRQCFADAGLTSGSLERPGREWTRRLPELVRYFRALPGDVLHVNLPSAYDAGASSVAWAARQAGYRRVVTTEQLPMIERKYRQLLPKLFFSQWIDDIIVNTHLNRELLIRRHRMDPAKLRIVENGVEDPMPYSIEERQALRASWKADQATLVIGIVGALTRRKGHHFLLEALAAVGRQQPALLWCLVVVGEGEEEDTLRSLADRLGVGPRVRWLGARTDAARLMQSLDLFVLPSTIEQMPFTILEAMAAHLPVISSSIFGIPEMVEDGRSGVLLEPGNVPALTAAILRLISDSSLRLSFGERARRLFETRFTAERMAMSTARIYEGWGVDHHSAGTAA